MASTPLFDALPSVIVRTSLESFRVNFRSWTLIEESDQPIMESLTLVSPFFRPIPS